MLDSRKSSGIGKRIVDLLLVIGSLLFAVIVVLVSFVNLTTTTSLEPIVVALFLTVVGSLALLKRRQHPLPVLGIIVIARMVSAMVVDQRALAIPDQGVLLTPAALVALFSCAYFSPRRLGVPAAIPAVAVMSPVVSFSDLDPFWTELAGEAALMALAVAVGDGARSRADFVKNLVDTESDRRVQAERLRIARDLHDLVAHSLSTISVQSGVASHIYGRDPQQVVEALDIINSTGKSALEELRTMVGVLRSTDDLPLRPLPTDVNDLQDVLASVKHAGLDIDVDVEGSFHTNAAESCVVALHRIVQEALTNIVRHSRGAPVNLRIHHHANHVDVWVTNSAPAASGGSVGDARTSGVGILGMKERAETLGGRLTAGPTSIGGFEVHAFLPYWRLAS